MPHKQPKSFGQSVVHRFYFVPKSWDQVFWTEKKLALRGLDPLLETKGLNQKTIANKTC